MAGMQGWGALGQVLGGGIGTPGAYEDGMMTGHKLELAMQQARRERANAMIDSVRADNFALLPTMGPELGISDAEARLMAAGGGNAQQLMSARGSALGDGYRQQAAEAAARRYGPDNPNSALFGLADGPVALGDVRGDMAIADRFAEGGGGMTVTPLGESRINRDRAAAASSYATANNANVRSQIAQAQFGLQRAGQWNPSGRQAESAGNRVFTFFENGRQTTAVSPDGQNVFGTDGQLRPLPPNAVAVTGARAIDELSRNNIRNELDSSLAELGASTPAPGNDPYAKAVNEISGPVASTLGRAATFVSGLAGDGIRQSQRDAESYVNNVNQQVKSTLVNNPRFPQFEQRIVDRLLPGPGMSAGEQVTRANELRRVIANQIDQKRSQLGAADAVEARAINNDIRQLTSIVNYMNQGPASSRSGAQPALGDAPRQVRVPVSRNAPQSGPVRVTSRQQMDALPSGTVFIAPDGSQRRKP